MQATLRAGSGVNEPQPLTEFRGDFEGFCREILGVKLWHVQIDIGNAVRDHPRAAVAACYSSGKTFTASCLVLWWLYTRRPAMVITTAPTGRQVRNLLWRQIKKLLRNAKRKLPGRSLQVQLEIAPDWWALGFASNNPTAVQGMHEENVLFIEDEAAGMDDEIVEAFEGVTAGEGSRHLKIGNPTSTSGAFYECFHGEKDRWYLIHISAVDTPNYRARREVVPGLVSYEWVEDKRRKWKENSPHWHAKVLGKFPKLIGEKVVPLDWVELAKLRWARLLEELGDQVDAGVRVLGVDIARSGQDNTSFALRTGRRIRIVDRMQVPDLMEIAARVIQAVVAHGVEILNIDATGLGVGVYDRLRQLQEEGILSDEVELNPVVLGKETTQKDTFVRLVDELQWKMREMFDPAGPAPVAIDPDESDLADQLTWRNWGLNEKFRIKVETKAQLRKRGAGSPDDADACMLACYEPPKLEIELF